MGQSRSKCYPFLIRSSEVGTLNLLHQTRLISYYTLVILGPMPVPLQLYCINFSNIIHSRSKLGIKTYVLSSNKVLKRQAPSPCR